MVKFFCDACGKEIPAGELGKRVMGREGRITTEILVSVDGIWNGGQVCHDCVRRIAVLTGEGEEKCQE